MKWNFDNLGSIRNYDGQCLDNLKSPGTAKTGNYFLINIQITMPSLQWVTDDPLAKSSRNLDFYSEWAADSCSDLNLGSAKIYR